MVFPTTNRLIGARFLINGSWVEASGVGAVLERNGVNIRRGASSWNSGLQPGYCKFSLKNHDLRYSVDNPAGPYYGYFGQNTPCGLTIEDGTNLYVPGTGYISTPDSAGLSVTGDLDIRCELDYKPTAVATYLCSKGATGTGQFSYLFYIGTSGKLHFSWSNNGTAILQTDSLADLTPGHIAVRVTIDVNNGSGGRTITFYTSDSIGGTWTQFGTQTVTTGITSIFDSTSEVRVGTWAFPGTTQNEAHYDKMEIRNGIAGTVVASPDFTAQTAGASSFADAQGNTWTVSSPAELVDRQLRFYGEIQSVEDNTDGSGKDKWVDVEVKTASQRYGRNPFNIYTALESWLRKRTDAAYKTEAYWPLDEGAGSAQGRPILGGYPMVFERSDSPNSRFGRGDLRLPWLDKCMELYAGDKIVGRVAQSQVTEGWEFNFMYAARDDADVTVGLYEKWGAVYYLWQILIKPSTREIGIVTPLNGTTLVNVDTSNWAFDPFDGVGKMVNVRFEQISSNVRATLMMSTNYFGTSTVGTNDIIDQGFAVTFTDPIGPFDVGELDNFYFEHVGLIDKPFALGHVSALSCDNIGTSRYAIQLPASGQVSEEADSRMSRICTEQGIRFTAAGAYGAAKMGAQASDELIRALEECATTDGGLLIEPRDNSGFYYRQLSELHNNTAVLTLDYSLHQLNPPFPITRDDNAIVNSVRVNSKYGGSGSFEQTVGRYKVSAASAGGIGLYTGSETVNVFKDGQTTDAAGWLVHLGTVDEPRMPTVKVNLASADVTSVAGLAAAVLAVDIGDRIDVINTTSRGVYDRIQLIVVGYSEYINAKEHIITFNCVPQRPYEVATLNTTGHKVQSGTSTTAGAFTAGTSTSMSVAVSSGQLWKTSGATPFRIKVSGVVLNVTAVSGASSPQTFTVDAAQVSGPSKVIPVGSVVKLERAATLARTKRF